MLVVLPPLAAEPIFHFCIFPITNSMLNVWGALLLFIVIALFINQGMKKYYRTGLAPKGILNFIESIIEIFLQQIDNVTGDRKKTLKFLPIVGGMFLFILTSNWIGILPGIGSIVVRRGAEVIPLFRSANSDLNLTLSMAVFSVVLSHLLGIAVIGFFKYANKFVKFGDIYKAIKSGKIGNLGIAIIEFFVGLLEIISEVAKMVSLSLRLFGNIFAGEVLLTVIASLISGYAAFGIPLPFLGLELLVGIIQAMVFALLTLVYLTVATTPISGHGETHGVETTEEGVPTM